MPESIHQLIREFDVEKKAKKALRKIENQNRKFLLAQQGVMDSPVVNSVASHSSVSDDEFAESVKLMTMDELQSCFIERVAGAASELYRAAVVYSEIRRRGGKAPQIHSDLREFYHDIAAKRLAPELFAAFTDEKLLRSICGIPLEEQRRLANGGTVEVVMNERGDTMKVGLRSLAANEVLARRVFRYGEIVPVDQQIANIAGEIEAKKPAKQRVVKIVRTELGQGPYRPIEPEAFSRGEVANIVVSFYPGELENLKTAAKSASMSEQEYLRRIAHEGGYLKRHRA